MLHLLMVLFVSASSHQPGIHLGKHRLPEDNVIDILRFSPGGAYFFTKYLHTNTPVAVRDGSSDWRSVRFWSNPSYVKQQFHGVSLTARNGKKVLFQKVLSEKLSVYNVLKNNHALLNDINLPFVLHCTEYIQKISGVHLHLFNEQEVNIQLSTTEKFVTPLFGPIKVVLFHVNNSLSGANLIGMDVRLVNEFPVAMDVPYTSIDLNPGDLLYMPMYTWYHINSVENLSYVDIQLKFFDFQLSNTDKYVQTQQRYVQYLNQQPNTLPCNNTNISLKSVLKINFDNDNATLFLRIPKKNKKPDDIVLRSGYKMPVLGFGTALLNEKTKDSIKHALKVGYRMFDLAQGYPGSEVGFASALDECDIPREDVFIVTKLMSRFLGYNETLHSIEKSLTNLRTSYIDLYLIHSVVCDDFLLKCEDGEPHGTWQESWRAMEVMKRKGKIRDIGVSNFDNAMLVKLLDWAIEPVSVVQNWFDLFNQDREVRKMCEDFNIRYMGFSTLGYYWKLIGILDHNPVLESDIVTSIASHYDYILAHVVLRWAIHNNVTVIPRSSNPKRIAQNFRTLDITLHPLDIKTLDEIGDWMEELQENDDGDME